MVEAKMVDIAGLRFTIRPLKPEQLGQLVALTSNVQWKVSLEELKIMHEANPDGFIGAFLDDGTLICHISVIKYPEDYDYVALFVTSLPYRGRGIGRYMFQYGLTLGDQRTSIIDAVVGKSPLYEKFGFKSIAVDVIYKFGFVDHSLLKVGQTADFSIEKITPTNVDPVLKYDQDIVVLSRSVFLRKWLLSANSRARCAVSKDDRVIGYIVVRPDHVTASPNSFKICGFYANDVATALELLKSAMKDLPDKSRVWVKFPIRNETAALSVYERLGIKKALDEWKMTKMTRCGEFPPVSWQQIYASTNCCNTFT